MKLQLIIPLLVFLLGWFSNSLYSDISSNYYKETLKTNSYNSVEAKSNDFAAPLNDADKSYEEQTSEQGSETKQSLIDSLFREPESKPSPYDWIKENQIYVFKDKVIINLKNAEWATFTPTHSMDPVLDETANAIEIIPASEDDIHIGDIISYKSDYADGTIIHRVTKIGHDSNGWYCITKGDNIQSEDPGKIRFEQIRRIVVAIIY